MNKFLSTITLMLSSSLLASLLFTDKVQALPDDENQETIIFADSSELSPGEVIYHGSSDQPAEITQGSLKISGLEITLERVDGVLRKMTARGTPARFQQQPEIDQGIIYASGLSIVFDNSAQLLTIDAEAEFIQDGTILTGCHIDYDLETKKGNVTPCNNGERLRMVIPPSTPSP